MYKNDETNFSISGAWSAHGRHGSAMNRSDQGNARPQGSGHSRRSMCSKKERELLLPYALTGCRQEEGVAFEAHLLQCEACFEDLKTLDRAAALIGDWAVARLTLADLYYNAPAGQGPNDRLRAILDAIPPEDTGRASKKQA